MPGLCVCSATKQYIQDDLHLTDTETSIPLTAFVFVYMLCSPVFSWLADLGYRRNVLIALGVIIWSISTAAGALAINFWTLLLSRSLVGVGEAAYATIAPALLSDFYPPAQRNAVLSIFYLAIPIGAAMGYAIGGEVGGHWGWRIAFLVAGAPGLLVAAMCLAIREPEMGATDVPTRPNSPSAVGVPAARSVQRSASKPDLSFSVLGDDDAAAFDDDDSVTYLNDNELGGGAISHPHIHHHTDSQHLQGGSYQPPLQHDEDSAVSGITTSRSIVVRSVVSDGGDSDQQPSPAPAAGPAGGKAPPWGQSALMLLRNPTFVYCTVGLTAVTFASGGLADWIATWMYRVHDVSKETAATMVGALTCVGGIVGTAYGAWAGEWAKGRIKQPYLGVAALNMVVTTLCAWGINLIPPGAGWRIWLIGALVFVAQVCLWAYTGPINALTINCVSANMRVRAFAFQIFLTHALGDAIAPTIVGAISDATNSIRTAICIVPLAFTVASITWLVGWRRMANDAETYDGSVPPPPNGTAEQLQDALQRGGGGAANERSLREPLVGQRQQGSSGSSDSSVPYGSSSSSGSPHHSSHLSDEGPITSSSSSVPASVANSYEASADSAAIHLKRLTSQQQQQQQQQQQLSFGL